MTSKGYINDFYKQFEGLNKKLDKANSTISQLSLNNSLLLSEVKELKQKLNEKDNMIAELILEVERLKNNNKKDSSNSSKPSGTNGYKKVVTNNRKKSSKSKGGQINHPGSTLSKNDIDKMIENGKIDEVITIEENKTEQTKNNTPIITYEYDIQIKKVVIKHVYYPNEQTNIISSPVFYGNNVKTLCSLLYMKGSSYDAIKAFIAEATEDSLNISKGTIYNWNAKLAEILETSEYEKIKAKLLNSLVLHVDETPIKINREQYYIHNISNEEYTLQYVNKKRGTDAIKEFGFLKKYKGILVHDHFSMYYQYGTGNAECNVHALRYLKGVTDFTEHKWAKKLSDLLLEMKVRKKELIAKEKTHMEIDEYELFKEKFLSILKDGKNEYKNDLKTNSYREEERKLLTRLEKFVDNHLLFLKKFFVPFSNNRAEADLRFIKIRQKIGKFRSEEGAHTFVIMRSCSSTYSKKKISVKSAITSAFENKNILT